MIELKPENLHIDREKVLAASGCLPDSPVYDTVCGEYEKYRHRIELDPEIWVEFKENSVYVLITVGKSVSDYSDTLMDSGECLAGLLVNAYADEAVFELDKTAAEYIKKECAVRGVGAAERMELSPDTDSALVREFMSVFGECGVSLTSALMLDPPKSMGYILRLTDNKDVFNAQHDCASCPLTDCPRRSVPSGSFDIVSGYEYPVKKSGKNVICIDIGTTTLVFCMIKKDGTKHEFTAMNMQRRFGADVISRIEAANRGRGAELREIIILQIIKCVKILTERCKELPEEVIISGNTVMTHLLLGYPCTELGKYPFTPHSSETVTMPFDALTRSGMLSVPVTVIGGISAFVGGDIVSGLYMCGFDLQDNVNLFIDLGTNGEMAIGNGQKILVSSAAAGPAFEGGKISCGTGSVDGAVCSVDIRSNTVKTINDKAPCGICGTGIIEAVAGLYEEGLLDKTGLLDTKYFKTGYPLAEGVTLTQNDIREIQTAKSAVRTGVDLLIARAGASYSDIDSVYIAGGFGYRLNPQKACAIGLIPKELAQKVKAVGNSSLGGAVKYALSDDGAQRVRNIQSVSEELSVAQDEQFNELYLKNMYF